MTSSEQFPSALEEALEVTYRVREGEWSDQSVLQRFLDTANSPDSRDSWYVARWTASSPDSGGLEINLSSPDRESDPSFFHSLLKEIHSKLAHGLYLASEERGWPIPRFTIQPRPFHNEESWTYFLELGPFRSDQIVIHPNKVLAVGEADSLSPLLGLECSDPVFGLPAKWVTFSQSERAAQQGSLLFEASEVVISHAINFVQAHMEHAIGLWEVNQWLSRSLPEQGEDLCLQLKTDLPLILKILRDLLKEGLYLPNPGRFCEHFQISKTSVQTQNANEIGLLVRKEVVNDNIPRWLDDQGYLNAVEWKGPSQELRAEDHHRMLGRLSQAIQGASFRQSSGRPVLLVDMLAREELAEALGSIFPELPILAWSDLRDLSRINTLASINAELSVDSSGLPGAFFSVPWNK